eukprot:428037-Karenia_brevis.AAC.1
MERGFGYALLVVHLLASKNVSFPLEMKNGEGPKDVLYLKAACPESKESAAIDLFKLYTNMGGRGTLERNSNFTNDDII